MTDLQVRLKAPPEVILTPRVTLSLLRGEVIGLMGPNGSGKSVLTRAALGVLTPPAEFSTSGEAWLAPGAKVGYSPQNDGLLPWRRIESNLRLPHEIHGTEEEDELERLIEIFGLKEQRKKFPQQLSGGYRVRAALCRAMSTCPDLLVFDEPSRELDNDATKVLMGEVARAKRRGTSVWLISHEASLLEETADHCLLFGRIDSAPILVKRRDAGSDWSAEFLVNKLAHLMT